jgi:hypothetical protein
MTKLRRLLVVVAAVAAVLTLGVLPAAAHSQTVQPPAQDAPTVQGPISQPYAQAHCHAQAPAVTGTASSGVVIFSPPESLPCPPVENPGEQVHPKAG